MGFYLTDDGTMDTVVRCENCGQEERYNFDGGEFTDYDEFIAHALEDAEDTHECPTADESYYHECDKDNQ